jgi:hypothetical protein
VSNAIQVKGTARLDVGEQAETGPQMDREVRQPDSPQEEVVTRMPSYRCPVCKQHVRPDTTDAVETEDDHGKIQFWHSDCYDRALEASE